MSGGRQRGAGHGHDHGPSGAGHRRPLAIVLGISATILIVEVIGAVTSGSLALLADAGHMLADVAGLSLALAAAVLAARPATQDRTWGYRRAEVLAAAAQAAVLLAVGGFVLAEAIRRLIEPSPVASGAMLIFGVVGLAGNTVSIVLIAAVVIALTGWDRADAVASLLIGALILPRTWKLLRETVDVLMEASSVASDLPVLTAHVVVDDSCFRDGHLPRLLDQLQQCLAGHFDVEHSTVQFEPASHAAHEYPAHA